MSLPVDVLASEVLRLPTAERARLLSQVISSLQADAARDARWHALAAERDAQADADLGRRESDPGGGDHGFVHVVEEGSNLVRDRGNGGRRRVKHALTPPDDGPDCQVRYSFP